MRVLAIDGGGIRGIIPARVLVELERITERPVSQLFDLIVGTSTGGIIALGLTKPGAPGTPAYSAEDALALYTQNGPAIFPGGGPPTFEQRIFGAGGIPGWKNPFRAMSDPAQRFGAVFGGNARYAGNARYSPAGLEALLSQHFGATPIADALTNVAITAYDMKNHEPVVFSSAGARAGTAPNPLMAEVARATSPGPTYFPPLALRHGDLERILVDGGLVANNPVMIGYVSAGAGETRGPDPVVVSLGTGAKEGAKPDQITYGSVSTQNWPAVAVGILSIAFDGGSKLQDAFMQQLLPATGLDRRYWRLQATLTRANSAMDDVSSANIAALLAEGDALVTESADELKGIAGVLLSESTITS